MSTTTRSPATAEALPGQPRMSAGRWFTEIGLKHLLALVAVVYAGFPLVYVISSSLNPSGSLTGSNEFFKVISFDNYVRLFNLPGRPYGAWYVNSIVIGIVTSLGTVLMGALAAYAFSRMRFTGRRFGLLSLLLVQMFPQLLAMVAIFLLLISLGDIFPFLGIGSQVALIMVYLGGALGVNTWLMYGFFNTVPTSLDESARVDGAGHARIFFTIILRLVAPILAVVGLLSFIGTTNEYVLASVILTSPETQTLPVGLYALVSDETSTYWPVFSAGAVLAAIPVMVLFLYLQKYIVSGLTAGAVK
jgi:arabinogalactan oligomer/maltooligosaccharide transport system permease protein